MTAARSGRKEIKMTADLQQVKAANQALVLRLLHREEPLSRAALTAKTRLSPTTVSSLVEGLLGQGLIRETGIDRAQVSGRKPVLLAIRPEGAAFLAAELLRDRISMALYDLRGTPIGRMDMKTDDYRQAGALLIAMAEQLLREAQLGEEMLWGICLGIPGIIDRSRGYVVKSTVLPVAADNPFCSQLRERFPHVRVLLENQSSLCAYAEQDFQAETGFNHLLYMDIGIGIGAGIVLDGRLIRGADGLAGEIGHMTIDLDGPKCPCGNRGCLERLASVPALIQRIIAGWLAGRETRMRTLCGGDLNKIDLVLVRQAALAGDGLVLEAIGETARALGAGIVSVLNLLNLQAAVLGGDLLVLGDLLLDPINRFVSAHVLTAAGSPGRQWVYAARTRGQPALAGGVRLLLDQFLLPEAACR